MYSTLGFFRYELGHVSLLQRRLMGSFLFDSSHLAKKNTLCKIPYFTFKYSIATLEHESLPTLP